MDITPKMRSGSHLIPQKTQEQQVAQQSKGLEENPNAGTDTQESEQAQAGDSDQATFSESSTALSEHEANSVAFEDKPPPQQSQPKEMKFQEIEDTRGTQGDSFKEAGQRFKERNYNLNDPAVKALMDYVRELQDQNIQALLDGLDQSLENARKMMEENMEHFYTKVQPQMDQAKDAVQSMLIKTESNQQADLSKAKSQYSDIMQDIQAQLTQAQGKPEEMDKIKLNLDFSLILNTLK